MADPAEDPIGAVAALGDPVRRRLYDYVAAQPEPVGREQAAEAAQVPVHSARFHLDRLVAEGLLTVEFRRLSGRSGPGAGRPAKLYRRAPVEIAVSIPSRGYDLVGQVLAAAVQRSLDGDRLDGALTAEARAAGVRDGEEYDSESVTGGPELDRCAGALAQRGFEPRVEGGAVELRNCPFDTLAREHTALVCGVNRDYVAGVLDGLGCRSLGAHLDPGEDRCCVRVEPD
jgi:predicted ArsR family transcriptional regulator